MSVGVSLVAVNNLVQLGLTKAMETVRPHVRLHGGEDSATFTRPGPAVFGQPRLVRGINFDVQLGIDKHA